MSKKQHPPRSKQSADRLAALQEQQRSLTPDSPRRNDGPAVPKTDRPKR